MVGVGKVKVSLIVAMTLDGVIGAGGDLPWHISEDLRFFKSKTIGGVVIMGRKTYESMGGALGGRYNIVISGSGFDVGDIGGDVEVCDSLSVAMERGFAVGRERDLGEVFVIGGGEVFRQSLGFADIVYVTEVDLVVSGDVYFPEFDFVGWGDVVGDWVWGVNKRTNEKVRFRFIEYTRTL